MLALELLTLTSDATRFLLGLHHIEGLTSGRCAIQAKDQHGFAGTSMLDLLVTLVEHCLDTAIVRPREDDIPLRKRTILHQNCSDIATTLVE